MANLTTKNPLIFDTFTSDIDLTALTGRDRFAVEYILWQKPTTLGHACVVTDDADRPIFDEVCCVANDSKVLYFGGNWFKNIKIAQGAVGSGKVQIMLRGNIRM